MIYKYSRDENRLTLLKVAAKIIADDKMYVEKKKKAKFWNAIATGTNQSEYVLDFRPKENAAQKLQRLKAYNPLTEYITEKIKTIYSEADRSNKVIDKYHYDSDDSEDKVAAIKEAEKDFYAGMVPREYVESKFLDIAIEDQNSYEVVDYTLNNDSIVDRVFSKTYSSKDVMKDEYFNGWLQYVVVRDKLTSKSNKLVVSANQAIGTNEHNYKYTMHADHYKISAIEIGTNIKAKDKPQPYDNKLSKGYFYTVDLNNKKVQLFVEEVETLSKRVPAIRYDVTPCKECKGLNESILRPAKSVFIDNIQKKANYDVILKTHGIYRDFARVPKCNYRNSENGLVCRNGKMSGDGGSCPACKGTGKQKLHNTDLDIITFPLDEDIDPNNRVSLSEMFYSQTLDSSIIEMYAREVENSEKRVSLAIFNTNVFDRKELLAGTATEIRAQFKNVNNKLYKYEKAKSRIVRFLIMQLAIYKELDDGLMLDTDIPSDFELETLDDLLTILEKAKSSGAPQHFISDINVRISQLQHEDEPHIIREILAYEKFKPFSDVSEDERINIVSILSDSDPLKVKYLYYSEIVKDIKNSEVINYIGESGEQLSIMVRFEDLPYKQQKLIFESYASAYYQNEEEGESVTFEENEESV